MAIGKRFALWASALLLLTSLATAQKYSIIDLGVFHTGSSSQGQALNAIGQVAGYADLAGGYVAHGFLWSERTGLVDLGSIPPSSNFSAAQAINSFGDIVGYSVYDQNQDAHAVLWNHGTILDLGTLPGGTISQANGINDLGQITGFSNGAVTEPQAFLWAKHSGMRNLGTLPGGYYSQGLAINIHGEVVGFSNSNGVWYGFLWNEVDGMQKLPGPSASANGINDLGEVVGGAGASPRAMLWHNDKHHTAEDLGVLTGTGWSSAFAINDLSQVVGRSGFVAFLWTQDKGMQDLNTLIPGNSGWSLSLPTSINVLGQITGQGTINGEQHGFLLTPVPQ
jgi:probable HAF family extracellular repeat protein